MNNKFFGIYYNDENGNYILMGLYPYETYDDKRDEFAVFLSYFCDAGEQNLVDGRPKYAHMIYETSGEPLRVYPAFPVEQLNSEWGPYTLAYYHQSLLGKPYNHWDWREYDDGLDSETNVR